MIEEQRDKLCRALACDANWVSNAFNYHPGDSRISEAAEETIRLKKELMSTPDHALSSFADIWARLADIDVDVGFFYGIEQDLISSIGFSSSSYLTIADLLAHIVEEFKIKASTLMNDRQFYYVFQDEAEADQPKHHPRRVMRRRGRHTTATGI